MVEKYDLDLDAKRLGNTKYVKLHGKKITVEPIFVEDYYDIMESFQKISNVNPEKMTSIQAKKTLGEFRKSIESVIPDLIGIKASPTELIAIMNLAIESSIPDEQQELKKAGIRPKDHQQKKTKQTAGKK